MKKMKILYIIPAEGFGGAERQAIFHISNLPKYNIEVVAVTGPGCHVLNQLKKITQNVYFYSKFPKEYGKPFEFFSFVFHIIATIFSYISSLIFIFNLIRKEKIELIFASRVAGWALAAPVSILLSIPSIWRFGSRVQGNSQKVFLNYFIKLFKPSLIISNCQSVYNSIKNFVSVPAITIPNGIDTDVYNMSKKSFDLHEHLGVDSKIPLIGLAVRPSPDKGMDFLSEVVEKVVTLNPSIHFCVAGEFGWRNQIENYFINKGLEKNINFLGYIDDIISFYLGCEIIILTSRYHSIEGFPNSLLESMAIGKPVVATNVGGISEFIQNGINGFLVDGQNSSVFANKIIDLIDNQDLRLKIGINAKTSITQNFSINKTVKPIAITISSLIKNKSNSPVVSKFHNSESLFLTEQ